MIYPLQTLVFTIFTLTVAAAFPVVERTTSSATVISLVNFYANPDGECRGSRTPVRLVQHVCYGPVDNDGFQIASIVGSVDGNQCQGMLFHLPFVATPSISELGSELMLMFVLC
jgi:hypothetical protein